MQCSSMDCTSSTQLFPFKCSRRATRGQGQLAQQASVVKLCLSNTKLGDAPPLLPHHITCQLNCPADMGLTGLSLQPSSSIYASHYLFCEHLLAVYVPSSHWAQVTVHFTFTGCTPSIVTRVCKQSVAKLAPGNGTLMSLPVVSLITSQNTWAIYMPSAPCSSTHLVVVVAVGCKEVGVHGVHDQPELARNA